MVFYVLVSLCFVLLHPLFLLFHGALCSRSLAQGLVPTPPSAFMSHIIPLLSPSFPLKSLLPLILSSLAPYHTCAPPPLSGKDSDLK